MSSEKRTSSSLPALLWRDLRERISGNGARANARCGFVRPPDAPGRVVWMAAGHDRRGVRLGVELLRAIRERRRDVRLVLTFDAEHPDLLQPLAGLRRTGYGFGPCARPGAVRRTLRRLAPLGTILVGDALEPQFGGAIGGAVPHLLAVGGRCPGHVAFERAYPETDADAAACAAVPCAPPANLLTLVTPPQVDPNFRALVNGGREGRLWWWHGTGAARLAEFVAAFRSVFPGDLLLVSGVSLEDLPTGVAAASLQAWDRSPLATDAPVLVDHARWWPAVAASAAGVHLDAPDDDILWQALAAGAPPSIAERVSLPKDSLREVVACSPTPASTLERWRGLAANAFAHRAAQDAGRKAFWEERRLAGAVRDELLERVLNWD